MFIPKNDISTGKMFWLEEESLNKLISPDTEINNSVAYVEDISLDDTNSSPPSRNTEFPIKNSIKNVMKPTITPMTHLVYSVTWFSLAFAGAFMTYTKFKQPNRLVNKIRKSN